VLSKQIMFFFPVNPEASVSILSRHAVAAAGQNCLNSSLTAAAVAASHGN
jgi:hypothetical protein